MKFFTALLLSLMIAPFGLRQAVAQEDCQAYLNRVLADSTTVQNAVVVSGNSSAVAASSFIEILQVRQSYEDNTAVPSCASALRPLMIQWTTAAQDQVGLVLAIYADPVNSTRYNELLLQTNQRFNNLAGLANQELTRIQATVGGQGGGSTPTQAAPADWYRVYFTEPINSNNEADFHGAFLEQALIFVIDNTRSSIDAALFEIDAPDTTQALLRAMGRGVRVRLVLDDEHGLLDPESTAQQLINAGAQVRSDERSALMHSKFFIFDSVAVWTGATNITGNGIYNNNNNAIYVRSAELAANFQAEFEEMFTDGAFSKSEDTRPTPFPVLNIGGTRLETYFSPEDGARIQTRLVELIRGARSSVRVMAFSFTLQPVGQAMIDQLRAGVRVEGVFETTGSLQGQMTPLACAGANVRQDGNPSIMHHKVFIIDERIVVLGSFNFSASARDSNTENMLVIDNPTIAAAYTAEFQRVYAEGRAPDRNRLNCPR
jgi:phosphatidylserine/phosphatidylglycerophosphate/cardiolipin synthase-like enzyme